MISDVARAFEVFLLPAQGPYSLLDMLLLAVMLLESLRMLLARPL